MCVLQNVCEMILWMFQDKAFGSAGETVVVEELLDGEEVSVSISCL